MKNYFEYIIYQNEKIEIINDSIKNKFYEK